MSDNKIENDVLTTPEDKTETEATTDSITPPEPPKKRSGGPRTPEGKARSSQNARRHAITARVHIATPEESAVYDKHLESYLDAFSPVGVVERDLVLELASLRHRLKRVASLEDSIFAIGHDEFAASLSSHPQAGAALAEGMTWLREAKSIQLLSLYESRLRKAAEKTQAELERLQAARKEAYAEAQEQAIRLARLAVHEGNVYTGDADFQPAADHGQFVFSAEELVRAADFRDRLRRSWQVPDVALEAA